VTKDIAESLGLEKHSGALVSSVLEGSPADKAGMKPGDVVLSVDGSEIESPRSLSMTIASMAPGSETVLEIWRRGGRETLSVRLGEMPGDDGGASGDEAEAEDGENAASAAMRDLGMEAAPAEEGEGIVVS